VSEIQSIRAKSATAMRKAQPATSRDDDDAADDAVPPDDAAEDVSPPVASPPPGMGKLVDRSA
jgi:hypothetical protein